MNRMARMTKGNTAVPIDLEYLDRITDIGVWTAKVLDCGASSARM